MIISFDIDNTLIPYSDEFEVEERKLLSRLFAAESIRKGTIDLFKTLKSKEHQIWIYTTSFRSVLSLKRTFKSYGLSPSRIINERINQQVLKKHNCRASKNPKLFGIDIHVDDSKGVGMEGDKYGFKTIILETNNEEWVELVISQIELIEQQYDI